MKRTFIGSLLLSLLLTACAGLSEETAQREAVQARLAKAEAMFQERCKKSGEFIYRTAENVEGVFLLKLRPSQINRGDQYRMDDPYGSDLGGDGYIKNFLRGYETRQAQFVPGSPNRYGYHYVDAIDPKDGKRYRYTGGMKEVTHTTSIMMGGDGKTKFKTIDFVLDKVPAPDPAPRYGVTYDDISTREERDYWIAGSSLRVIDLKTSEVMAERIGYMIDRGQGGTGGGRAPWLLAANNACPHFFRNPNLPPNGRGANAQLHQTEDFVEKILKPKLEK
ncbi:MAG: hypothetical protein F9K30_16800 [Dechloromonas sp.]|nr:MAG: hypothetical protein F9K30_16800 [Dechloromonas sp.]